MTNPFMEKQKLFSIISPCYGDDWKHLDKVAIALNEQQYKKFEWIVVFDGKNKEGEKVIKKLIKKYKWSIQFFTISQGGAPKARNFGATKAKGDYYCFLDSDKYLYSETLRIWANIFENPKINRVWGIYDVIDGEKVAKGFGMPQVYPNGKVWYQLFKYSNYCDTTFPVRKEAYIEWDENCKSLQDWDWAIRMLKKTDFRGDDWHFEPHSFFAAENVEEGGISHDSHINWIKRVDYVRDKNNIPKSDICVTSLGAPHHAFHIAEKLGADYLPMPAYKPHNYKMIYLIGFYTKEDPANPMVTRAHMSVFDDTKAKKVIHWIGTDVWQLRWNCSFEKIKAIKKWIKDNKIINLTEFKQTYNEMREVGIDTRIVPLPPNKLNQEMPLPNKFSVAIYEDDNNPMHQVDTINKVIKVMPDIQFYFIGPSLNKEKGSNFEHLGYVNMEKWMPKFSCNLRISIHDGLPLLPIEFMTAGRQIVTNVNLKGAIVVKNEVKSIISGIRKAQKEDLNKKYGDYWRKEMDFKRYIKKIKALK